MAQFGLLELTALPSILEEHWLPALREADVLLVGGGNTPYLSYWMDRLGLAQTSGSSERPRLRGHQRGKSAIVVPLYAIDDQTALKVVDGKVRFFDRGSNART